MRIALDTNRYVDFSRGERDAVERIRHAEQVVLPFVVLGELRAGFLCGTRSGENEANLTRFLASPRVGKSFPTRCEPGAGLVIPTRNEPGGV